MRPFVYALLIILIGNFVFLTYSSARAESLTYDEIVHQEDGLLALTEKRFELDPYNPPLSKQLAMLPRIFGLQRYGPAQTPADLALSSRLVSMILAVGVLIGVFLVGRKLGGDAIGLFAVFLLSIEPTFLAHSHYITPDMATTFFVFVIFWVFIRYISKPEKVWMILLGVVLGLGMATRVSIMAYAAAVIPLMCLTSWRGRLLQLRQRLWEIGVIVVIALTVVWGVYGFTSDVIVIRHDDPARLSSRLRLWAEESDMQIVITGLDLLQNRPVPLGKYISVLKNNVLRNTQSGTVAFLGVVWDQKYWAMTFVDAAIKIPIPIFLLSSITFVLMLLDRSFRRTMGVVFVVIVGIFLVTAGSSILPLVRYLLPVIPFLALFAAASLPVFMKGKQSLILIIILSWYITSSMSSYPHFIAYGNEFIRDYQKHELLKDSDIDWGQGLLSLRRYLDIAQPSRVLFLYFGRDDAAAYGFPSRVDWGGHRYEDICALHPVVYESYDGPPLVLMSVSGWYDCGYYSDPRFSQSLVHDVVGDSILVFLL